MEKYVIDASALLTFFFPDEKPTKEIKNVIDEFVNEKCQLYAPELLKIEIGNALRSSVLRKRMSKKDAKELFNKFLLLNITYLDTDLKESLELSIENNISLYDGIYVHLSKDLNVNLITRDNNLKNLC